MSDSIRDRHVVIYAKDVDIDYAVTKQLSDHINDIAVVSSLTMLKRYVLMKEPKVLVFSSESVEESTIEYFQLLEMVEGEQVCEHKFVLFCKRHDEEMAFTAFVRGVVDEFIVTRPLYDKYRPTLVIWEALKSLGIHYIGKETYVRKTSVRELSLALEEQIELATERKRELKDQVTNTLSNLEESLNNLNHNLNDSVKTQLHVEQINKLIEVYKHSQLLPEMNGLQRKTLDFFSEFIRASEHLLKNIESIPGTVEKATEECVDVSTLEYPRKAFSQNIDAEPSNHRDSTGQRPSSLSNADNNVTVVQDPQVDVNGPSGVTASDKSVIRVLLVEDDSISVSITSKLFEHDYFDFEYAMTGRQAINMLGKTRYDVIFLDILLPDCDGINIASQLLKNKNPNHDTPIVMLTGNKSKLSVKRAASVGAKAYIVKPMQAKSLNMALKKCQITIPTKAPRAS